MQQQLILVRMKTLIWMIYKYNIQSKEYVITCQSKWCSWLTALSQVVVASIVVYAGLTVEAHMESWSGSFKKGSNDLHSIRTNMNTIAYSMESINKDMDQMNITILAMEEHINDLNDNITIINRQMNYMNGSVGNMSSKFSPQGMARSLMPF